MGTNISELPKYRCHKEVWALKIKEIQVPSLPVFVRPTCRGCYVLGTACGTCERCAWERSGSRLLTLLIPFSAAYGAIPVTAEYIAKHKPVPGGYYVVYKDGYQSFSPAEAFEDGYSAVGA